MIEMIKLYAWRGGHRERAYAGAGDCGALCWRLWSTRLCLFCVTGGHVLLQPKTVVWSTRLFSPLCYDLEFTVP